MVGIRLNDTHTYYDLGFILSSCTISSPTAKTQVVDIAGGDGVLDLTDYFGEPKFNNRELIFDISKEQSQEEFKEFWSEFQNEYNGQKVKITLDDDSDFYYTGRLSLSYTREKTITRITITCDCEPYKLKHRLTECVIEGTGTLNLWNLRKKVNPKITTTHTTKLIFKSTVFNLGVGAFLLPELELASGDNVISVESVGKTIFEYQEGGL